MEMQIFKMADIFASCLPIPTYDAKNQSAFFYPIERNCAKGFQRIKDIRKDSSSRTFNLVRTSIEACTKIANLITVC